MRHALLLASLLGGLGCASVHAGTPAPSSTAATEDAEVAPLRFAWPRPARVTVTERTLKKGKRAALRYDAVLTARPGSDVSELRLERLAFLELEGRDVSRGPQPAEVQAAQALASAIPVLVISPEGELLDVVGMEQAVARILATLPQDAAAQRAVKAVLEQPGMSEALKQKGGEFWQVWVGAWAGAELAPGEERRGTMPFPLADGAQLDGAVTLRHLGADAAHPGAIRLEMETALEGEELRRSVVAMMGRLLRAAAGDGQEVPDADALVQRVRKVSRLQVVTDPATLRPVSARSEQTTYVTLQGQGERAEREERDYDFRWEAAVADGQPGR